MLVATIVPRRLSGAVPAALGLAVAFAASAASAEDYAFLAAPQTSLNRMFRVETTTGEVGVCQFAVSDRGAGVTLCYPPGEGAGPQEPGLYALAASNHQQEGGVYRVERRTGRMSLCYVLAEQVVCTPQAR
jgi:hypothetical protein